MLRLRAASCPSRGQIRELTLSREKRLVHIFTLIKTNTGQTFQKHCTQGAKKLETFSFLQVTFSRGAVPLKKIWKVCGLTELNLFVCRGGQGGKKKLWHPMSKSLHGCHYHMSSHFSSHHSFSLRTCSSSLGVKSFLMLNCLRISSGVLPLIMLATVLQVTSSRPLMSK